MVLTIVKIALIVLVIIIIILLLLLLISIDYDVKIIKDIKVFKVYLDIKYFFNLVRLKAIYNDGFRYNARIFFFKFNNKKEVLRSDAPVKTFIKEPIDEADYIFYDRDELLGAKYDNKSLKISEKNTKKLAKIREKKKDKKSVPSRIIDIIKERKIKTVKFVFSEIKKVLAEIRPTDTKIKWDIFGFDIKFVGKILPVRLIIIALQVYFDKDTRKLILG